MKKKEEIKIKNFKELYASLKQNLQDTSEKLSGLYNKIDKNKEDLKKAKELVIKEAKRLEALKISSQAEIKKVQGAENVLEKKKETFDNGIEKHEKDIEEFNKYKEVEKRKIGVIKIQINELLVEKKQVESSIKNLEKLEKTKKLVLLRLVELHSLATKEEKKLEKAEKDREKRLGELSKKERKLEKELLNLEKEISKKQKSADGFRENVSKIEKRMKIKARDLWIYEKRLRKEFNKLGKRLIVEEIKVPTFKQK